MAGDYMEPLLPFTQETLDRIDALEQRVSDLENAEPPIDPPPIDPPPIDPATGLIGYGRFTTGGEGGTVLTVTDPRDNNEGEPVFENSIRWAWEQVKQNPTEPHIIRFDVPAAEQTLINLLQPLYISECENLTIEGRTSPTNVILQGSYVHVIRSKNIFVDDMEFRCGDFNCAPRNGKPGKGNQHLTDGASGNPLQVSSLNDQPATSDIYLRNVTALWGIDECLTCWDADAVTFEKCLIAECLDDSYHPKGPHSKTSLLSGGLPNGGDFSLIDCVYANGANRNPAFNSHNNPPVIHGPMNVEMINCLVYNWKDQSTQTDGAVNMPQNLFFNHVGCAYKTGPDWGGTGEVNIMGAFAGRDLPGVGVYHGGTNVWWDGTQWQTATDNFANGNQPNRTSNYQHMGDAVFVDEPYRTPIIDSERVIVSGQAAYDNCLNVAGTTRPSSQAQRIRAGIANGTGRIINSQDEVYP